MFIILLFSSPLISTFNISPFVAATTTVADEIVTDQTSLRAAINTVPDSTLTTIALDRDITLTGSSLTIPEGKHIKLTSDGDSECWKLFGVNNRDTIIVNGILELDGINVTHTGDGRGITVNPTGNLTMISGTISGNNNTQPSTSGRGGGVYNTGSFKMVSGIIANNTSNNYYGGGVYNRGSFEMVSGIIANNTANHNYYGGGGVYNTGSFKMVSGTIANNTSSREGGGVYNSGSFEMLSGIISNNIADTNGGGVYNVGSFEMVSGTISNNIADTDNGEGGGVYNGGNTVSSAGSFEMVSGTISNNTASFGGGVAISRGSFEMVSGTIANNTATNNGGGVCKYSGVFVMLGDDCTITNNTAGSGGGVYNRGSFEMVSGTIANNTATSFGGGVYNSGSFEMLSGIIANNTATNNGGGVYTAGGSSVFVMLGDDCTITNNTSNNNGGGVSNHLGSFEMLSGIIANNTAKGSSYGGGGVFISGGSFEMLSGIIANNTATNNGGGVYLSTSSFTLLGGVISGNVAGVNGGGIWLTDTSTNLNRLSVADGVVFSNNCASAAYNRHPDDDVTYENQIGENVVWTSPFLQGYNNYDISYVTGTPITSYTVTVQDSYAPVSGAGTYVPDSQVTVNAGTQEGYTFAGWIINEGDITLSNSVEATFTMPGENVAITAQWIQIYDIYYNLNGGINEENNPTTYTILNLPLAIINPARAGYTFLGWTVEYSNGFAPVIEPVKLYSIPSDTTGTITLTAHWSPDITYSIEYQLNGGNYPNAPTLYAADDLPLNIANPTKGGYTFLGWTVRYENGTSITVPPVNPYTIPEGTTGDILLTALWVASDVEDTIKYTITYHGNGHTSGTAPLDANSPYVSGSTVIVRGQGTLVKDGYKFIGWTTNPNANTLTP